MPGKKKQGAGEQPRTDLPPKKRPYDEDYFGTGEEQGVEREREASGDGEDEETPGTSQGEGSRDPAE